MSPVPLPPDCPASPARVKGALRASQAIEQARPLTRAVLASVWELSGDGAGVGDNAAVSDDSWRVSRTGRIGSGVALLGLGLVALIDTAANNRPLTEPLPLVAVLTALWWFGAMRPAVRLTADELVVRNPLWTRRIARMDVVSARPGYVGVVIRRRSGRPCIAWAIQKANASEWAGTETRADRAAARITHWAQAEPTPGH